MIYIILLSIIVIELAAIGFMFFVLGKNMDEKK
jgi:flagellar basal body-associated protein FliL